MPGANGFDRRIPGFVAWHRSTIENGSDSEEVQHDLFVSKSGMDVQSRGQDPVGNRLYLVYIMM